MTFSTKPAGLKVRKPTPKGRVAFSFVMESNDLALSSCASSAGICGDFSEKSKPPAMNPRDIRS